MAAGALAATYHDGPRISRAGLAGVAGAHLAVVAALLQMQVITLPAPLAVLSVSLLPAAEPAPAKPEIVPPRPKAVARQERPQPQPSPLPQLAAPAESPAVTTGAVPPPPTFVALAPPAPSAPVATQPRFDANYLDNPKPPYPPLSRKLNEEGKVVLRVRVDAEGHAVDVQLHAGSGVERLDNSALNTVRRWKFIPARLGSEPVAATVLVPIVFSLKD